MSSSLASYSLAGALGAWVAGLAGLACLAGCSSSSDPSGGDPPGCRVSLSGNVTETETETGSAALAGCSALSAATDDAGGSGGATAYVLKLQVSSAKIAGLTISVGLGASPSAGSFSSETLADWNAEGLSAGNSDCAYSAGAAAVPTGSFSLDLSSVSLSGAGGSAHGTIALEMYVHAPPATDCGVGDVETVQISF